MSPHKAEARLIGTNPRHRRRLLPRERRRRSAWRRYTGRADHCIEIAMPLLKAIETDADSVTLTLTRTGGHYLAECETRPGRSQP